MLGERLAFACKAFAEIDALLLALLIIAFSIAYPTPVEAKTFAQSVKDRPVLESVQQVWQAQTTGISEFDFDGVHYVIEDLPREYVKYSSWYCRMP